MAVVFIIVECCKKKKKNYGLRWLLCVESEKSYAAIPIPFSNYIKPIETISWL